MRGGGAAGIQWRPGLGENEEESDVNPISTLVQAGAQRGEELRGGRLRVYGGGAVAMLQLREGGAWGVSEVRTIDVELGGGGRGSL